MNYPFAQNSYFWDNFLLSFIKTYIFLNILKDLLNVDYEGEYESELRKTSELQRSHEQDVALEIYRNHNKDFGILI